MFRLMTVYDFINIYYCYQFMWKFLFSAARMGKRVTNSPSNDMLTKSLESNPTFINGVHKFNNAKRKFW